MAGLGFKDFQVGEVLTSSDVDGYLMQQTVMRFADAGARGSALGTAAGTGVPLAEGMVSYLDNANYVQVYNGTSWVSAVPGIGSNVVQTVKTDTFTTTSSTFVDVTNLTVSITPSSASSKVLVVATVAFSLNANTGFGQFKLDGGNTSAFVGDAASTRTRAVFGGRIVASANQSLLAAGISYLDSPATASSVTYSVKVREAGSGGVYINREVGDADDPNTVRGASSIIAMEVAA